MHESIPELIYQNATVLLTVFGCFGYFNAEELSRVRDWRRSWPGICAPNSLEMSLPIAQHLPIPCLAAWRERDPAPDHNPHRTDHSCSSVTSPALGNGRRMCAGSFSSWHMRIWVLTRELLPTQHKIFCAGRPALTRGDDVLRAVTNLRLGTPQNPIPLAPAQTGVLQRYGQKRHSCKT